MITESLPWPLYSLFHVDELTPRKRSMSTLLRHYETPGVSPPSSRINPAFKQQVRQPMRIWDVWRYGAMVAFKGEHGSLETRHAIPKKLSPICLEQPPANLYVS